MNKELAIECIKTQMQFVDEMTRDAFEMAVKALEGNCSEIPNNWIPCTPETMPEESGAYICTCIDAGRLMVTQIKWQPKLKSWNLSGARSYWKVIAWQEIKPYQPKEE